MEQNDPFILKKTSPQLTFLYDNRESSDKISSEIIGAQSCQTNHKRSHVIGRYFKNFEGMFLFFNGIKIGKIILKMCSFLHNLQFTEWF